VLDEIGGVLPGVSVTLCNNDRGTTSTQTTGTNGEFRFMVIQVGQYELKIELASFSTVSVNDVTVNPGSHQSFPLQMKVGTLEVVLTVTADAPLLNTKQSTESVVLNDKYLATPPSGRRWMIDHAFLPGRITTIASRSSSSSSTPSTCTTTSLAS
jgi:hypothetical protein